MDHDDRALIIAHKNGDKNAFASLVSRYTKPIYNYNVRLLNDHSRAEDATQETFIKVWRHIGRFHIDASFKAWIFTIAHRTALDHMRKKRTFPFSFLEQKHENSDLSFEEMLADTEPTPEEYAVLHEQKELIEHALMTLPQNAREVLILHYNEELTFDEIGKILGKPLNTVKSTHRRALSALRDEITRKAQ